MLCSVTLACSMLSTCMATAGAIARVDQQRIGVMDVDLGLEQRHAHVGQRLRAGGQLDDQQLVLGESVLVEGQDLPALLRVAQDQPEDRAIGRVGDRQADDPDLRALERPIDLQQLPHAVLEEDRELRDRRPASTVQRFQLDFAAAIILAITHEVPRRARSGLVRNAFSLIKFNFSGGLRSMVMSRMR